MNYVFKIRVTRFEEIRSGLEFTAWRSMSCKFHTSKLSTSSMLITECPAPRRWVIRGWGMGQGGGGGGWPRPGPLPFFLSLFASSFSLCLSSHFLSLSLSLSHSLSLSLLFIFSPVLLGPRAFIRLPAQLPKPSSCFAFSGCYSH